MASSIFSNIRDWVEPAHPGVIRQYETIVALYTMIRDRAQPQIDDAFDRVSRQIGYLVATTVPVTIEVGETRSIDALEVGGEQLKGTMFEEAIGKALADLPKQQLGQGEPGRYDLFAIWHAALKLKLRKDWMEPAHVLIDQLLQRGASAGAAARVQIGPGIREPAHFFDPSIRLSIEDLVLVSALDEVYPDIHLGERIASDRLAVSARAVSPHVHEPAHFRPSELFRDEAFVSELGRLVQRFTR